MKRIVLILLLCILVFTACGVNDASVSNDNVNSEQKVETAMIPFREKIIATEEKVSGLFSNEFEDIVISHLNNIEIIKYVGPNNTFDEVCNQLKYYCTPNVAEMLAKKAGYINVDGAIGYIMATGEVTYPDFEETDMEFISTKDNITTIKVTRYTLGGDYSQDYKYTFETNEEGNLIITDIVE